jgi:replicative DNA helicase
MSLEIESRVIGALLAYGVSSSVVVQEAFLELKSEFFLNRNARNIYELIYKYFLNNESFDILRINDEVSDEDHKLYSHIIGAQYTKNLLLTDIIILKSDHLKLRMLDLYQRGLNDVRNEVLTSTSCEIGYDFAMQISKLGIINDKNITNSFESAEKFLNKKDELYKIIPTGINILDKCTKGGFRDKSLITIAGRPSMGKTSFAVHLSHSLADNHPNKHVLFYSLEMSDEDIYQKQLASILRKHPVNLSKLELADAIAKSQDVQFTIDTTPLAQIDYIESSSQIMSLKKPISVLVVDYIGLVQNKSKLETHVLKQADISLRLAALAKKLNCIVIALTQVNRDYSSRDDKCPITSDAADSSGSERSSSYWIGIHRPEVDNSDDHGLKNQFFVKCRKDRWSSPWQALFDFNDATFWETSQHNYYQPIPKTKGIKSYVSDRTYLDKI